MTAATIRGDWANPTSRAASEVAASSDSSSTIMPAVDAVSDSTDWLATPLAPLAPIESALRCQMCKEFFDTPMITSCSHTFCSLCIRRYLSQEGRCPACRSGDQENKLRRNWVVEELVASFTAERERLLAFGRDAARRSEEAEEDVSPRPKKRRKVQANDGSQSQPNGLERRSTRSQSRKEIVQASQQSLEEEEPTVADSEADSEDDEGDEASSAILQPKRGEAQDGLVACPMCGTRMKEEAVFPHLDTCTGDAKNSQPTSSQALSNAHSQPPNRQSLAYTQPGTKSTKSRLPTLAYSMLNDNALRKKLKELGINNIGPKLLLQKRHTEWINLWNANDDSRKPKTKRELLRELDTWERTQGRQILQSLNAAQGPNGVMAKDFDGQGYVKSNKDDFDDLIRKAREKRRQTTNPIQSESDAGPDQDREQPVAQSDDWTRSLGRGTTINDENELRSHGAEAAKPEQLREMPQLQDSPTKRSPFFGSYGADGEALGDRKTPPAQSSDVVDLTSPAKPSRALEHSQSQGSQHMTGMIAS